MIEISEVVETTTWATVRCSGQERSIQAAVIGREITFHRGSPYREGSLQRDLRYIENGSMTVRVRAFALAVRRLQSGDGIVVLPGNGYFRRTGENVVHRTTCGEQRTFALDDLVALAEWAQEPDPS